MSPAKKRASRSLRIHSFQSAPRFCDRCGHGIAYKYIAEERRKRLFCRQCGAITYLNPRVVAGAIPMKNGKILLLRRGIEPMKGLWTFPAGFVELGETVRDAAIRETFEETRVKIKPQEVLGVYSYEGTGVAVVVYHAKIVGGKAGPTHESLEVREFAPAEIPWSKLAFFSTRDALKDFCLQKKSK